MAAYKNHKPSCDNEHERLILALASLLESSKPHGRVKGLAILDIIDQMLFMGTLSGKVIVHYAYCI
jgi:hypothetical protein